MKSFDAGGAGASRPIFSISAVARMLGIPVATIRTWEDRYGLIVPDRNASGHRLYSRDQIEQLRFVHARLAEDLSAADAHRLLAEWLEPAPSTAPAPPGWPEPDSPAGPAPPGPRWPAPLASPEQPGPPALPAPVTVLLAERDPFAAEVQEHFLSTEGFEVEVALSAEAARAALAPRRPAVAVMELLISGGTGLDLCRFFRQQGVPVIVSSVLQARDQALDAGADAFLGKPLDPVLLASAIRDLLGLDPQPRPRQEAGS
jgi:DNA-binding transcriptional MerR regulator